MITDQHHADGTCIDTLTSGITNDEMWRRTGMKNNRSTSPIISNENRAQKTWFVPYFYK